VPLKPHAWQRFKSWAMAYALLEPLATSWASSNTTRHLTRTEPPCGLNLCFPPLFYSPSSLGTFEGFRNVGRFATRCGYRETLQFTLNLRAPLEVEQRRVAPGAVRPQIGGQSRVSRDNHVAPENSST
jgi:hypothetical protein